MEFKPYKKIHALHKEECDGILIGTVHVQEKIDGANASIWAGDDGQIHIGSRTRDLTKAGDGFNGFKDWIDKQVKLREFLLANKNVRLYGEWLVRHTISYNELSYKQFYLFDIEIDDKFISPKLISTWAEQLGIPHAHYYGEFENPTPDILNEFIGSSTLGHTGEGVVVKNLDFINKFGDFQYGKIVTQSFKEDNSVVFGGNNKYSNTYYELYFVNKYVTVPRVQKIINKIMSTTEGLERMDMKHIPQVMNMVYHDLVTEEIWEISKEMCRSQHKTFSFGDFKRLCDKKSKQIFIELLEGNISVAHV